MGVISAVLFLLGFVLFWALLPYLPGLREIWQRTDIEPLRITRRSEVDIRYFARGFRRLIKDDVAEAVAASRGQGEAVAGTFPRGDRWLAVGGAEAATCIPPLDNDGVCSTAILAGDDLHLPDDTVHVAEVYGAAGVRGGAKSVYRALLSDGDLHVGRESVILRWIHADGDLHVDTGTLLCGRASCDRTLRLEEGCAFERLNAPEVVFGVAGGEAPPAPPAPDQERPLEPKDLPNKVEVTAHRWFVLGKFEIPAGRLVRADLVGSESVVLGPGCRVEGGVKARQDLEIGDGAQVTSAAVAGRDVTLGEGVRVGGPVISERTVTLGRHCLVGSPEKPTTVTTETITCGSGARCHGTVWARERGVLPVPTKTEKTPETATEPVPATEEILS
ncbi:MAG: hypothetical protein GY838_14405 [bacterium]|nr:hypothetical protein [bacterium]